MTIAASRLKDYLDPDIPVRVCLPTGCLWHELHANDVKALASQHAIVGVGSASKLRHCTLQVAPADAQAILDRNAYENSLAPTARGRLASSEASQTTVGPTTQKQHHMARCNAWPAITAEVAVG